MAKKQALRGSDSPTTILALQQEDLKEMLSVVTRSAGKSVNAMYEMVRLDLVDYEPVLQLSCFNGSFAAIGSVPVQVIQNGDTLRNQGINAETAKALAATLAPGQITLGVVSDGIQIQSGQNRSLLKAAEEIIAQPQVPQVENPIELTGKMIKRLAQAAVFASTDLARPGLTGVLLRTLQGPKGPLLEAQAADGVRLGRVWIPLESAPDSPLHALIPASFLRILGDSVSDEDTVTVFREKNLVYFKVAGERRKFSLLALVLDDKFPDTAEIVKTPSRVEAEILLDIRDIALATRQVNIISRDSPTRAVFIKVLDAERVGIASLEGDYGETRHSILVREVNGSGRVWLQAGLFAEILAALTRFRQVRIQVQGPCAPVRIQDENAEFLAIIMPLDIKEDPYGPQMTLSELPANLAEITRVTQPTAVSV